MKKNLDIHSHNKNANMSIIVPLLILILICFSVFALCLGKYDVTVKECLSILFNHLTFKKQTIDPMTVNVVLELRLPRIIGAILIGAGLSVAGSTYQGIFKNPLVSPDFLGVSSGACIGAAIAILLGLNSLTISLFAFIFGILAVIITASLPLAFKNRSNIMLVLSGVIIGSLMSSILGFLKYVADPESQLASITYWTMGSFANISNKDLFIMSLLILPPLIIILFMSWWLDVLSMGDNEAKALGANVTLIKTIFIIASTILTATSVCFAGTIGWVGLIVPHFTRLLVGSSNKRLIPTSILIGGIFVLIVDTLTRIISVNEMPVSIMTGLIGVPFFLILMYKERNKIK